MVIGTFFYLRCNRSITHIIKHPYWNRRNGDLPGDWITETTGNDSSLGVQPPEDAQESDAHGDTEPDSIRPGVQDLGIDGQEQGGGDEQIGHQDTGGTGLADNGSGGTRGDRLGSEINPGSIVSISPSGSFRHIVFGCYLSTLFLCCILIFFWSSLNFFRQSIPFAHKIPLFLLGGIAPTALLVKHPNHCMVTVLTQGPIVSF